MLEKIFGLKENGTTPRREVVGGITTFMTMAYILVVSPAIMSQTGMDYGALFTATALSAALASLAMGLMANLPIALAPGMGINAFFAYTVVLYMGYSWEMALAAVFIEGLIFILLSIFNVREMIVDSIPPTLKEAIGIGIGLFIAIIGLVSGGVITSGEPISQMGTVSTPSVYLTLLSIVIIGALLIKKVPGGMLIGMLITTVIALALGVVSLPENFTLISMPNSIEPIFFKMDFSQLFSLDMAVIIFTMVFADIFDTAGTIIACTHNMVNKDGHIKNIKQAFLADAVSTSAGALLGMCAVTSYVESASGIAAGARTGLASVATAAMFILALFCAPLFSIVPNAATAAVLVVVGLFMMASIASIDFTDYKFALPAFITILFIPLSYNIATGISYGFLSYVILHMMIGRYREISPVMYILALVFILNIFI